MSAVCLTQTRPGFRTCLLRKSAMPTQNTISQHPRLPRRTAIQAGAVGLLGLGMNHVEALHSLAATAGNAKPAKARSVIYIFLSGGLAQHDSFDMKPNAADGIRGEFNPI